MRPSYRQNQPNEGSRNYKGVGKKRNVNSILLTVFLQHLHAWMRKTDIDTQHRTIHIDPIHTAIGEAVEEQFVIGWENAFRGRLSKKWGDAQKLADTQMNRRERSGLIANLINKLWEQMHTLWRERNEIKHGRTTEEIQQRMRRIINPLVRAAYESRETSVSIFNQRLFRMAREDRLKMSPVENTRWLEIVQTATTHRRLREEAVIVATRRITDIYPIRIREPDHQLENTDRQREQQRGDTPPAGRMEREKDTEKEE